MPGIPRPSTLPGRRWRPGQPWRSLWVLVAVEEGVGDLEDGQVTPLAGAGPLAEGGLHTSGTPRGAPRPPGTGWRPPPPSASPLRAPPAGPGCCRPDRSAPPRTSLALRSGVIVACRHTPSCRRAPWHPWEPYPASALIPAVSTPWAPLSCPANYRRGPASI